MGPVSNIYSADSEGNVTKLTDNNLWRDITPDVSTDGKIAFSSNRYDNPSIDIRRKSEDLNIFIMDKNGSNIRQLTDSPKQEVNPQFSPNAKLLAYLIRDDSGFELALLDLMTGEIKSLATAQTIPGFSWSPDNKTIAYAEINQNNSALKVVNIKEGTTRTIINTVFNQHENENNTALVNIQIASAQWSPDGKNIAYIRHPITKDPRSLYVYNVDNNNDKQVSVVNAQVQSPIDWSKDGKRMLYSALVDYKFYYDETTYRKVYKGGMHIFLADLDGNNRQLTQGDHLFKYPVFSPNEKYIAYLYADKLDERTLSLRMMDTEGTLIKELDHTVAQRSSLEWYR